MCGHSTAYNTYATMTTIDPLFMGFSHSQNVLKEIIISTREYFSIFIPEVIRLLGFSILLHFVDFSIITNQIIKNRKEFVFHSNYSGVNTNENTGKRKIIRNCRGSNTNENAENRKSIRNCRGLNTNESTRKQECIRNRRGTNTNESTGKQECIRNRNGPNTNNKAGNRKSIRNRNGPNTNNKAENRKSIRNRSNLNTNRSNKSKLQQ